MSVWACVCVCVCVCGWGSGLPSPNRPSRLWHDAIWRFRPGLLWWVI